VAGDLLVGQPVADQGQDLALAVAEPVLGGLLGAAGEQGPGDLGPGGGTGRRRPRGPLEEVGRVGVLERVADGAGVDGVQHLALVAEGGQDDHPEVGVVGEQAAGGLDAAHAGHGQVHEDHVGVEPGRHLQGLAAVGGRADHPDVLGGVEQRLEPGPDQPVVVGQQHPVSPGRDSGWTRVPRPGWSRSPGSRRPS
jgi:hypothetical protein